MQENLNYYRSQIHGINVICSDDVPNGYRRTAGNNIYVSPWNYELMKPLSAKMILMVLGILKELENRGKP